MLAALFTVLPILACQLATAVPLQEERGAVELEYRQWGGNRGGSNRGRPSGSRARPQSQATAGSSQTAAAGAVTSAPPAAGQNTAGGANSSASQTQGNAANEASGAGTAATGASGAASTGAADTGTSDTGSDSTGWSDSSNTGSTGTGSETDSSTGSSGGPAGTGWDTEFNKADLTTYKAAGLQWWYNWQLSPTVESIVEYVPMIKFGTDVAKLSDAMAKWPDGTRYVFSFNEPDQDPAVGGTAMTAADAAQKHNEAVKILDGNYQISTPGVARGGFDWMDQWVAACEGLGGCHYDFIAYHYYGTDVQDLISSIKKMHDTYGKKVWLTEWDCHEFSPKRSCSKEEAETFMKGAIEWFRGEGASIVTRWAWFGAFTDMTNWHGTDNMDANRIANADGTINELGKTYLSL